MHAQVFRVYRCMLKRLVEAPERRAGSMPAREQGDEQTTTRRYMARGALTLRGGLRSHPQCRHKPPDPEMQECTHCMQLATPCAMKQHTPDASGLRARGEHISHVRWLMLWEHACPWFHKRCKDAAAAPLAHQGAPQGCSDGVGYGLSPAACVTQMDARMAIQTEHMLWMSWTAGPEHPCLSPCIAAADLQSRPSPVCRCSMVQVREFAACPVYA